jgi:chromosome segregation ATPase
VEQLQRKVQTLEMII